MKNTAKKLIGFTLILAFLGASCVCAAGAGTTKISVPAWKFTSETRHLG